MNKTIIKKCGNNEIIPYMRVYYFLKYRYVVISVP